MPTSIASGTQTATITTEHTLATDTANHTYVAVIDMAAMVGGTTPDITELRIYTKALSGGAEGIAFYACFVGLQHDPIKYSVPVPADISCKFTLKQTQGTGRAFPWKLLSL